jgi:ribosomal protein L21E
MEKLTDFEKGDIVKVAKSDRYPQEKFVGWIGRVLGISGNLVTVFLFRTPRRMVFRNDELEKVEQNH